MKYTLEVASRADSDVQDIVWFIAQDNVDAALRFYGAVMETYEEIQSTPLAWLKIKTKHLRVGELRKRGVKGFHNFLVVYHLEGKLVKVLGVFHGSRDLPVVLSKELFDGRLN